MKNNRRRKSTIRKGIVSAHTRRFRALYEKVDGKLRYLGDSPPIRQRTLTTVGGIRIGVSHSRKDNIKDTLAINPNIRINPLTTLPLNVAKGLESMVKASRLALSNLLPKSKRELKRNT